MEVSVIAIIPGVEDCFVEFLKKHVVDDVGWILAQADEHTHYGLVIRYGYRVYAFMCSVTDVLHYDVQLGMLIISSPLKTIPLLDNAAMYAIST